MSAPTCDMSWSWYWVWGGAAGAAQLPPGAAICCPSPAAPENTEVEKKYLDEVEKKYLDGNKYSVKKASRDVKQTRDREEAVQCSVLRVTAAVSRRQH